jgi:hypothetical protein
VATVEAVPVLGAAVESAALAELGEISGSE